MQALLICDTMPQLLAEVKNIRVHSVFQHACNLQTPQNTLITLQTMHMPLAPRGCILPCENLLPLFQQGEQLSVTADQRLLAASCEIHLKGAPQSSLRLKHQCTLEELIPLAQALADFLPRNIPDNGMYQMLHGQSSIFPAAALSNIQAAVQKLRQWLQNPNATSEPLEKCFQQLVGFGIGLTPSADDFLEGILLIMDALKKSEKNAFSLALTPSLSRTTDVSKAMLKNAIDGRYGAQLLALIRQPNNLPYALTQVVNYGHSSGHDMLCGIAFALACLLSPQSFKSHHFSHML